MAKKRGLVGRILRKAYVNMLHNGIDPELEYSQELTTDELVQLAAYNLHLDRMKNDPVYRQQMMNQQMVDQIAQNQQALMHHIIDQGMTWLLPRIERDFADIIRDLKDE